MRPIHAAIVLGYAFVFMFLALVFCLEHFVDARGALLAALGLICIADYLCLRVIRRGQRRWIGLACALMATSLFVLWNSFLRAPFVFGLLK